MKISKSLRPTSSKVREALFNILRGRIDNARFLDLYAGTGAVGIEALKHGASETVFVEAGRSNVQSIDEAIHKYRFAEKARVVTKKVLAFIDWAEMNGESFDIIFLDPPYHTEEIIEALSALGKSNILRDDGTVAAEHFTKKHLPDAFGSLHKIRDYTYGDTVLSLYEKE
ncbi:MAG: 16S rRNA (guanine(966)-N(2))-methyltransferase RsmD [Nitrospirae bacterium]|nr:16S rRNA (guanine(966)-N(2))-methyltransferase RsmD [Nitrospirota bacterium]